MKELGEEIKKRDWPAIKDEAGDVMYSAQMIAHQKSGINFPMIGADGSIKKFQDRRAIWKQIFKDHGGEFHTDYLKGGSNYARPEKIQKALGMAGIKIDNDTAASVSRRHTEKQANELVTMNEAFIKGFLKRASEWQSRFKNKELGPDSLRRLGFSPEQISEYASSPSYNEFRNNSINEALAGRNPADIQSYSPATLNHPNGRAITRANAAASAAPIYNEHPLSYKYHLLKLQQSFNNPSAQYDVESRLNDGFLNARYKHYGDAPPTREFRYNSSDVSEALRNNLNKLAPKSWDDGSLSMYTLDSSYGNGRDPKLPAVYTPAAYSPENEGARAHEYGHDRVARMSREQLDVRNKLFSRIITRRFPDISHHNLRVNADEVLGHWEGTNPGYSGGVLARELPLANYDKADQLVNQAGGNRRLASVIAHLNRNYSVPLNSNDVIPKVDHLPGVQTHLENLVEQAHNDSRVNPSAPAPAPAPAPGRSILPSAMNVAKSVGKGFGVGVPISMAAEAIAPTTMSTPGQQQQHPVASYFNDVAGHWLDSGKAFGTGAATMAALSGGVGAIPGAIGGGIGDLVHKGWNAAKDVGDIAGNLGGTVMGNMRASGMENKLKPVGSNSTIIPPLFKKADMNKEAYGIGDYDERSNKTYVYERSPLDNPLWFSRGDHKNNIKLLKWMESNKNPKVKYTLNKNKYTDEGELSIADLLKLHGNNPEELSNYIFDHTESSGSKFHSPFDWKKLDKHMNKEAILRGFYKRADEVKLAAFPDNTLGGVGLMGAVGLILSPLVAAINLAANKVAPTDEEEKNRTYINQLKRDLWRAPLLGASIGAVRGGLEDYRSYNVNKEAMLGEFYKRAGEILNKSLIDAVASVKPEDSENVLKRLAQIKEPFMTPTTKQVLNPLKSRNTLIAESPKWENNAQPQFAADMTNLQAKPVAGVAEILAGLRDPKTLNKEWTNIAVRQPINVGFSNAVMRALSPTPAAVASQK